MERIEYSCDRTRIDFARVHAWLAGSYWSPGIPRHLVERGFARSTAVCGAYAGGVQVGVARALSDSVRFGYVADVYVDEAWRRRGIARELVRTLMATPDLADVESWLLLTKDAHAVYAGLGFAAIPNPERVMGLRRPRPW